MNRIKKLVLPPPAEKQKQASIFERVKGKQEISEIEFQENLERVTSEIENKQNENIVNANKRIENISASSSGLTEEKAITIYEQGGFAGRINGIKKQIMELVTQAKMQIESLALQRVSGNEKEQKYESVREYPWSSRLRKIREASKTNLNNILERYQIKNVVESLSEDEKAEIKEIQDTFKITVNIGNINLLKTLKGGKIKSTFDTAPLIDKIERKIFKNPSLPTSQCRRVEEWLGILPEQTRKDPALIYGAVAAHSNPNDFKSGAGPSYGKSFFVLKNSVKERATFTYSDSWSAKPEEMVTEENIGLLKFLANRPDRSPT